MEELQEICKWLKEQKGITKITMEELLEYVPEFEEWKSNNNLKIV